MYILEDYDYLKFQRLFESTPGNEDSHYIGPTQPSIFAASNRMVFTLANIIKYVFRYKNKSGIQDLEKGVWYSDMQSLDHDNFLPPVFIRKRIDDKFYIKSNPQFNEMQKKVSSFTYLYNITGNWYHINSVKETLTDYIKDYDANER